MKRRKNASIISMLFLGIALILTGCGSGGGGTTPDYTIGGTVSGLSGTLALQNNGGDDLTVKQDGSFTFATALADGSRYSVTVKTQPDGQTCTVSNNTGKISGADVTDVTVTCSVDTYTVGGTVNGLSGTLTLQNNGGDDLTITSDGTFTFLTALADGSGYNVTVKTRPAGQSCTVSNNTGTISGANITNVAVTCSADTYTVGGTVSGLSGTVELQNNGKDDLQITSDGTFTFSTAIADGSGYSVTVKTQPAGQTCFVTNGSGTVSGADVTDMTVDCYNSGSLDPTFNSGGTTPGIIVSNNVAGGNGDDGGNSITMDANGKILVSGYSKNSSDNYDMVIWKYNTDGTPDTTFGTNGIIVSNNAAGGNGDDSGESITTDANGKILVSGWSYDGIDYDMVIWKYNADGTPDNTFNTNGIVVSNGSSRGYSITTDANGKILVTGFRYRSPGYSSYHDMVIWKYNANGTPDNTFNTNGIVVSQAPYGDGYSQGNSIITDANGKILVTGWSWNGYNYTGDMFIWRFNADGTPDNTFNTNGIVVSNNAAGGYGNDWGNSITMDANGKILVTGVSFASSGNNNMAIWKFNADGTPDNTFNTNGIVVSNSAAGGYGHNEDSITTDANGKILVTGVSDNGSGNTDMVIWRFNTDGTPDTTFDTNGIVISQAPYGDGYSQGSSITTDANGKILVSGESWNSSGNYNMVIWRYIP